MNTPFFMRHRGFEPRTTWLKVKCSTDWANAPFMFLKNTCPEPESNQRHMDFQSIALPTELSGQNCGGRIWTYDLRVMSPTSFQTAPPRDILLSCGFLQWMEVDSNHRSVPQQIYSLPPLATREPIQKADDRTRTDNLLITNQLLCQLSHIGIGFLYS